MKASKLLRRVRTAMADPKVNTSPYICDNLRSYGRDTEATYDTVDRLCDHIDELLGGAFSLREWLVLKGHAPDDGNWSSSGYYYHGKIDTDKLQRTRIAWLDHLISHYETQGD